MTAATELHISISKNKNSTEIRYEALPIIQVSHVIPQVLMKYKLVLFLLVLNFKKKSTPSKYVY